MSSLAGHGAMLDPGALTNAQRELSKIRYLTQFNFLFSVDHTRVKLASIDDEPGSDYINASYIHVSVSLLKYL